MTKRNYLAVLVISFVIASVAGNFTEKRVRVWVESLYEIVTGKPMVSDVTQTDEKGVPFVVERTIGKQRNPVTVANRALLYHDEYIRGDFLQTHLVPELCRLADRKREAAK